MVGVTKNLLATGIPIGGIVGVSRYVPRQYGLVYFAPLWHPGLAGATFLTRDRYGRLCTVTGATWGSTGRTFDGTADVIDFTALTYTAWSAIAWVYPTRITAEPGIVVLGTQGMVLSLGKVGLVQDGTGVQQSVNALTLSTWVYAAITRTGTTYNVYINGVLSTAAWNNAGWGNMGNHIGVSYAGAYLKGTVGEVLVYNRALSATEILNNYLATKWRYI